MSEKLKTRVLNRIRRILKKKAPMPIGWDIEDMYEDESVLAFETDDESIFFAVGVNDAPSCIEWRIAKMVLFPKKGERI